MYNFVNVLKKITRKLEKNTYERVIKKYLKSLIII